MELLWRHLGSSPTTSRFWKLSLRVFDRNLNNPLVTVPGLFCANLLPETQTAIFYQAEAEPALNGVARTLSTGGILGGGSSINAMMYCRAQGVDYDSFETEGWDAKNLIRIAKKVSRSAANEKTCQ